MIRWYLTEAGPVHAGAFEREIRRVIDLLVKLGARGPRNTRSLQLRDLRIVVAETDPLSATPVTMPYHDCPRQVGNRTGPVSRTNV